MYIDFQFGCLIKINQATVRITKFWLVYKTFKIKSWLSREQKQD